VIRLSGSVIERAKSRLLLIVLAGSISLVFLFFLSLCVGDYPMSFESAISSFFHVIFNGEVQKGNMNENIVWNLRLPRTMAVIAVGIGLSIAGAAMQAIIRNPLVDPYITGVSSGAMLGAMLALLAGISVFQLSVYSVPIAAFIGALLAFALTMMLSEASGGKPISFVLAGVMIGIGLSSFSNILMVLNPGKLTGVLFWMFGSFQSVSTEQALIIVFPTAVIVTIILLYARELNVVLLGEEQASQLGLNVANFKRMMMVLTSVLTGACVAFTGVIAFLGLIVPHTARMIVGNDHRLLLPASIVLGANVLLVADIVARSVLKSVELPIGAIISLIGVPFFAYLLIRRGKEYGA
jgi:iron complex transport system permease protein